jgi:hypothetical protein
MDSVVLELALVDAQLGIRRTPATARATDLIFRVMFIVFVRVAPTRGAPS